MITKCFRMGILAKAYESFSLQSRSQHSSASSEPKKTQEIFDKVKDFEPKEIANNSDFIEELGKEYEIAAEDEDFQKTTEFCTSFFENKIKRLDSSLYRLKGS